MPQGAITTVLLKFEEINTFVCQNNVVLTKTLTFIVDTYTIKYINNILYINIFIKWLAYFKIVNFWQKLIKAIVYYILL